MTSGYLDALRTRGACRAFIPALVGRLSFAMVTLVLLYAVQRSTGSFAVAGAATGAFGLANVIASPYRARFVDRQGQRFGLCLLAFLYAVGLVGLGIATAQPDQNAWVVISIAAGAGVFPPPLGAAMRVVWASLTKDGNARMRAYSLDAVAEELLFTTGPLIAAALVATTSPQVALCVTAGIALAGTIGMTSGDVSRAQLAAAVQPARSRRPLKQPGFVFVLIALLAVGVVLGTVEVAAPAVADHEGSVGLAGILLAAFAAGSAIGGLVYGRRTWRISLTARLITTAIAMTVLVAFVALLPTVVSLGFGLAAVGFFLAPSLVTGYLLADELTAAEVRTEASSWINTAVNAGAAGAAITIGLAVDLVDARLGFLVGAAVAAVLLGVAVLGLVRSRPLHPQVVSNAIRGRPVRGCSSTSALTP